jgi:uncharacterized membrane protein
MAQTGKARSSTPRKTTAAGASKSTPATARKPAAAAARKPAPAGKQETRRSETRLRLGIMLVAGVVAALIVGFIGFWQYAAIVGWAVACAVFVGWVWIALARMDAARTKDHATREDPTRGIADTLVIVASIASLAAVIILLIEGQDAKGAAKAVIPILAIVSIVLSWFLVHTLFMLRYARLYYVDDNGGISFNQDEQPQYTDFAYLAFTLGATFQVSDTDVSKHNIRVTILRHAMLSYLFGSVILAATVNLVAGLAG